MMTLLIRMQNNASCVDVCVLTRLITVSLKQLYKYRNSSSADRLNGFRLPICGTFVWLWCLFGRCTVWSAEVNEIFQQLLPFHPTRSRVQDSNEPSGLWRALATLCPVTRGEKKVFYCENESSCAIYYGSNEIRCVYFVDLFIPFPCCPPALHLTSTPLSHTHSWTARQHAACKHSTLSYAFKKTKKNKPKNAPELHRTVQHHHHLCLPFEFFWKHSLLQREIHTFQLVAHTHTHTQAFLSPSGHHSAGCVLSL